VANHSTKRDTTHKEIKKAGIGDGWVVRDLHMVGQDFPDQIWAKPGINLLVECKSPGGTLSAGQKAFFAAWPGPKIVAFSGLDAVWKARSAELEVRFPG